VVPVHNQPLQLSLDGIPNADHSGIYAAQLNGHFNTEGLDVQIHQPQNPGDPINDLVAQRTDVALASEPQVLRARSEGLPVVSVASLAQAPLQAIISLPESRINTPSDLGGKHVGTEGLTYQLPLVQAIAKNAKQDPATVKEANVGFNLLPTLLSHHADAVLDSWNHAATDLRLLGKKPQVMKVGDVGVPTYSEIVLVANSNTLPKNQGQIRQLIQALARGTADVQRDPNAGLTNLLRANPGLDPRLEGQTLAQTLPVLEPPPDKPYGYQDPGQWQAFGDWMSQNGLLPRPIPAQSAVSNTLLPGQGL
jgi:putative hydroxymethylpyrimidine transport system substrate-binding protein